MEDRYTTLKEISDFFITITEKRNPLSRKDKLKMHYYAGFIEGIADYFKPGIAYSSDCESSNKVQK